MPCSSKWTPTVVCIALATAFAFVVGCGAIGVSTSLIVKGQPDLENAMLLDSPDQDFEFLGQTCNISRVNECWRTLTESDGSKRCERYYYARFSAPGSVRIWSSWPEYYDNGTWDCGGSCHTWDVGATPSGSFETHKLYDCWKPRGSSYEGRYECANDHCYKLSDPALVSKRYRDKAWAYYGWGGGLMVLALCSCCCFSLLWTRLEQKLSVGTPTVKVITSSILPAVSSSRVPSKVKVSLQHKGPGATDKV